MRLRLRRHLHSQLDQPHLSTHTKRTMGCAFAALLQYFGNCLTDQISHKEAVEWRTWLRRNRGLKPNSVDKYLSIVRIAFNPISGKHNSRKNPFRGIKPYNRRCVSPKARICFVRLSQFDRMLGYCDRVALDETERLELRLTMILSRFAGLRMFSELMRLRWEEMEWPRWDQDQWAEGCLWVWESKRTRRTEDDPEPEPAHRLVPMFPEVRQALEPLRQERGPVITLSLNTLRAAVERLHYRMREDGFQPWPKFFHNMRASCETELLDHFQMHVTTGWIGNSPEVARMHYLQSTEQHFRAACNFVRTDRVPMEKPKGMDAQGYGERVRARLFGGER